MSEPSHLNDAGTPGASQAGIGPRTGTGLARLMEIRGVLGVASLENLEIVESQLPVFFDPEALLAAARLLDQHVLSAEQLPAQPRRLEVVFDDTVLLLHPFGERGRVALLARRSAPLSSLETALQAWIQQESPAQAEPPRIPVLQDVATSPEDSRVMAHEGLDASSEDASRFQVQAAGLRTPIPAPSRSARGAVVSDSDSAGVSPGRVGSSAGLAEGAGAGGSPLPGSLPLPSLQPRPVRTGLASPLQERLSGELSRYIGPVARLLVAEICQPGLPLQLCVERLAREIDDEDDRQRFINASRAES